VSTGLILPQSITGSAAGWSLADYVTVAKQAVAAANGAAVIELPQLRDDERWLVDHAVIHCTSTTATELRWYEDTIDPLYLLDGSGAGNFDVGDWPAGLHIAPGRSLVMRWTNCTTKAVATVNLQARVLRRG